MEYRTGNETILLVEDEEPLRKVVVELLSQLGYNVLSAANAREALRLATDDQQVDLLITDVLMPEISGPELARQLQTRRPLLKVIFISGYDDGSLAPDGVLPNEVVLVHKPFTVRALSATLRQVLDN
ncbi:MAG TPA: response regulator [Candidatus Angelobacter sp.]|nr:response regulator [Candidatus Angelobacter sp.]